MSAPATAAGMLALGCSGDKLDIAGNQSLGRPSTGGEDKVGFEAMSSKESALLGDPDRNTAA